MGCMGRACASGYNADAKKHFAYLMHVLGGSFTLAMTRQNTHLFVPCKAGAKFNTMHKCEPSVPAIFSQRGCHSTHLEVLGFGLAFANLHTPRFSPLYCMVKGARWNVCKCCCTYMIDVRLKAASRPVVTP